MEGYLYKWTNYISGWKLRYFVKKNNSLLYFISKGDKPKGKINLSESKISEDPNNDLRFEIEMGTSIIYLKAKTISEREMWLKNIKNNTKEQNNIIEENDNIDKSDDFDSQYDDNSEKLQRKLNIIRRCSDKINNTNNKFSEILEKYKDKIDEQLMSDFQILSLELNRDVVKLRNGIEDMKYLYAKFHSEFSRIAEYFTEDNLVKNLSRKGRSINEQGCSENILPDRSSKSYVADIIKENSEIFFGAVEEIPTPKNNQSISIKDNQQKFILQEEINNNDEKIIFNSMIVEEKFYPLYYDVNYINKRKELPTIKKTFNFNVWNVLKDAVGKDLSKFCVPVYFNEPLSLLQRLCENFQYAEILNKAGKEKNSALRLALVAGFALGGFSMNVHRTLKPFNPLLGETYEYIDNELGFRYFAEQVSHHPPISSCYVDSEHYIFYTNSNAKSNFSIAKGALEFHPTGRTFIVFKNFNETISLTKPKAVVRGLLLGNMRLDCYGKVMIMNHFTEETCELEFVEEGIFSSKDKGKIIGAVYDKDRKILIKLEGNWLSHLDAIHRDDEGNFTNRETIWKKIQIEGNEEERYFFTDFAINLNGLNEELKNVLPPTDCRFRPDLRALENQDIELASSEKHRLEEKQRSKRKDMEKNHIVHKPMYFEETYDELNGELIYRYCRDYWKDRENKNFSHFPDIY